jgi:hypothetical protein
VKLAIAVAGILSIYFGYRLFCGLSFTRTRRLLVINGVSGAVLAVFGMALLGVDARSMNSSPVVHSRPIHKPNPAERGSFTMPNTGNYRAGDWLV